jgi:hypothetical protein
MKLKNNDNSSKKTLMEHFSIIVKLFVIMGLTWSDMFHFFGIKLVGSGSIHLGINYSVLNEMKQHEL